MASVAKDTFDATTGERVVWHDQERIVSIFYRDGRHEEPR